MGNDVTFKAQTMLKTNGAKMFKSSSFFADAYGVKARSPISAKHLMSLLLYTNFRHLRNSLNTTYYAKSKEETVKDIVSRHSEFGYFAKLLRESVELWGMQSDDVEAPSIYYFGFNYIPLFKSTITSIYSPLLTTASMNVALLSKTKNGVIVSMRPYDQFLRYFNCSGIADDIGKDEKLFIGGNEPFFIQNIHNIKSCANYQKYVTAINYFKNMLQAEPYVVDDDNGFDEETVDIIINLINKKTDDIPPYI